MKNRDRWKMIGIEIMVRDGVYSVDRVLVQSSVEYDINDLVELTWRSGVGTR